MPSFMLLLHSPVNRPRPVSGNPGEFANITREYMEWADRMRAAGINKGGNKLTDDAGKILKSRSGQLSTTDGPYPESKEIVGGFFLVSARDYAEACRIASDCPHVKYGSYIEVRQVEEL
ncbi:MAG TPA: YciI family protein [Dongiaceae bacterium]